MLELSPPELSTIDNFDRSCPSMAQVHAPCANRTKFIRIVVLEFLFYKPNNPNQTISV